jgi:hypothetical protein
MPRRPPVPARIAFLLLLLPLPARAEWVEWILDAALRVESTDNLNYSAFENDAEADVTTRVSLAGGRYFQAGSTTRLWFTADLDYQQHQEFDGLDGATAAVSAGLRQKLGLGPEVPSLSFELRYQDYQPDKSSWQQHGIDASLGWQQRFSERLSASAALHLVDLDGIDNPIINPAITGEVFDQQYLAFDAALAFLLGPNWQLSGALQYREGDFISACSPANVVIVLATETVEAITKDGVFGGCVYRLEAESLSVDLALSYQLDRDLHLRAGYQQYRGEATTLEYEAELWQLGLFYQF